MQDAEVGRLEPISLRHSFKIGLCYNCSCSRLCPFLLPSRSLQDMPTPGTRVCQLQVPQTSLTWLTKGHLVLELQNIEIGFNLFGFLVCQVEADQGNLFVRFSWDQRSLASHFANHLADHLTGIVAWLVPSAPTRFVGTLPPTALTLARTAFNDPPFHTRNDSLQATVEMEICVKLCGLRPGSPLVLRNQRWTIWTNLDVCWMSWTGNDIPRMHWSQMNALVETRATVFWLSDFPSCEVTLVILLKAQILSWFLFHHDDCKHKSPQLQRHRSDTFDSKIWVLKGADRRDCFQILELAAMTDDKELLRPAVVTLVFVVYIYIVL